MILSFLFVAASAGCYNGGVVLQASAARRADPDSALRATLLLRLVHAPTFVIGTALDAAGWVFQVLALTRASLTFVQPALGMGVFLLLAFAWFGLSERPRRADVLGACALAGGIALIADGAPSQGHAINWAHAVVPVAILAAFVIVPYAVRTQRRPVVLAIATGAAFSVTGLTTEVVSRGVVHGHLLLVVFGLSWSVAFGFFGFLAQTSALVSGRVTSVIPIVTLIDTAVPVALAPLVFAERWPSGAGRIIVLAAGIALAVAGAVCLAASPRVGVVRERASGA